MDSSRGRDKKNDGHDRHRRNSSRDRSGSRDRGRKRVSRSRSKERYRDRRQSSRSAERQHRHLSTNDKIDRVKDRHAHGSSNRSRSRDRDKGSKDDRHRKPESDMHKMSVSDSQRHTISSNKDETNRLAAAATLREEDNDILNENEMRDIELFMNEDMDEEREAERLAAERRQRREEILNKHKQQSENMTATEQIPPHVSMLRSDSDGDFTLLSAVREQGNITVVPSEVNAASEADILAAELVAVEAEVKRLEPTAFDIFSSSPSTLEDIHRAGAKQGLLKSAVLLGAETGSHLQSNWDDAEGYYKPTVGEMVGDKYRTLGVIGRGVFSTVLKCVDVNDESNVVAVKLIRNNDIMRKAAEKELFLLSLLSERDPENKKHCVKLLGHLEHRNHTTFIFESMQMNLRETLKKFGKNVGINVSAVRMYGRQLFVALRHLADLQICHADIKPDNILVSNDLKQVKICDFGSAFLETDTEKDPTPYLQSRFYRAPEVMLALPYDRMMDLWSIGVCLYEIFTGHVMFPGQSNNEMLRLIQAVKGRFPNKMMRSHVRVCEDLMLMQPHFDPDFKFKQIDQDPITRKPVLRLVEILNPSRDLAALLQSSKAGADDRTRVSQLADLLHKCLVLDPAKRCNIQEALHHPFFTAKDGK